jgi:transcriptional regulator with XRE-family HTH domain
MDRRLTTYLRPLRRRHGFTQRELAFLIGGNSGTVVSRIEGEKRTPSLAATIALAILFDAAPLDVFPGLFSEVHEGVLYRVNELYEKLQGNPSRTTRVKLDFLETVLARLKNELGSTHV